MNKQQLLDCAIDFAEKSINSEKSNGDLPTLMVFAGNSDAQHVFMVLNFDDEEKNETFAFLNFILLSFNMEYYTITANVYKKTYTNNKPDSEDGEYAVVIAYVDKSPLGHLLECQKVEVNGVLELRIRHQEEVDKSKGGQLFNFLDASVSTPIAIDHDERQTVIAVALLSTGIDRPVILFKDSDSNELSPL